MIHFQVGELSFTTDGRSSGSHYLQATKEEGGEEKKEEEDGEEEGGEKEMEEERSRWRGRRRR